MWSGRRLGIEAEINGGVSELGERARGLAARDRFDQRLSPARAKRAAKGIGASAASKPSSSDLGVAKAATAETKLADLL
eukprot:CAMPEP_0194511582 /NCGR_PEP_ID=MMETSP0253-20130528/43295_1 /TAXON_ID=2966 /ORGANISM="Noctiluca scintillans" /LENGTH=78 /DNA_ID=CAMNT_0039354921 /DNA_START=558 /DNA_END=794 /DNA_ORIENTATION=-